MSRVFFKLIFLDINKDKGTITYKDAEGELMEVPVTKGACKLQWKPDFGMRWAALQVDYEMYGKDHMPNANLYSGICRILGKRPPVQFFYELLIYSFISQEKMTTFVINNRI